jgi:hypothetical protein
MITQPVIKAYTISHVSQIIVGYTSYASAVIAIDTGYVDWAGTAEEFETLDKAELEEYQTIYTIL